MEWIGFICLAILIMYSSYPGKVDELEKKLKKLNTKVEGKGKGECEMSRIISELVGKQCKIDCEEDIPCEAVCSILDVDEEWVKCSYEDKKAGLQTQIVRIDSIDSIKIVSE